MFMELVFGCFDVDIDVDIEISLCLPFRIAVIIDVPCSMVGV